MMDYWLMAKIGLGVALGLGLSALSRSYGSG